MIHQYVCRKSNKIVTEKLQGDRFINFLYSKSREDRNFILKLATSKFLTSFLAHINFNRKLSQERLKELIKEFNIDKDEFYEPLSKFQTYHDFFERKIKFWDCRVLELNDNLIASPADSKMFAASIKKSSLFYIKEKFFDFDELIEKEQWKEAFINGDYAIFRLTPDKYHYNHLPVSGVVRDFYEIDGYYHSCNPLSVKILNPLSKNKRVVTVIDTDVDGGTNCGLVIMVELVAMMIGKIVQCYSEDRYDSPKPINIGYFLKKGCVKSLFRPGSSTVILFFQENRVKFSDDIIKNSLRADVKSRFSENFTRPIVETEVKVRETIAENIIVK